jgi:hypothetical protein
MLEEEKQKVLKPPFHMVYKLIDGWFTDRKGRRGVQEMAQQMGACYMSTRGMGVLTSSPTYERRAYYQPIWDTAREIFNAVGFAERTGFDGFEVILEIHSRFPPNTKPVSISTVKSVKCVFVYYSILMSDLPDEADEQGWKAILVAHFADAIERVFAKFKLDSCRVAEIRAFSATPTRLKEIGPASFSQNTSADVEVILPLNPFVLDMTSQAAELDRYNGYSESLGGFLEQEGLAIWSAEEKSLLEHAIIFETQRISETIEAIKKFSQSFALPSETFIKIYDAGNVSQVPVFAKKKSGAE